MVNTAERAGWVNARYLAYRTDVWTAGALPATLNLYAAQADGPTAGPVTWDLSIKHPKKGYPHLTGTLEVDLEQREPPLGQRPGQGALVHHAAAGDVDQRAARPQRGQDPGVGQRGEVGQTLCHLGRVTGDCSRQAR